MHEAIVAVAELAEKLAEAERKISGFEEDKKIAIERATQKIKDEISKVLTESDIKREVAIARLESYEKSANKDDFNKEVRDMLKMAIQGLGSKQGGQQQQRGQEQQKKQD